MKIYIETNQTKSYICFSQRINITRWSKLSMVKIRGGFKILDLEGPTIGWISNQIIEGYLLCLIHRLTCHFIARMDNENFRFDMKNLILIFGTLIFSKTLFLYKVVRNICKQHSLHTCFQPPINFGKDFDILNQFGLGPFKIGYSFSVLKS